METARLCQEYFAIDLPSIELSRRAQKFEKNHDNLYTGISL